MQARLTHESSFARLGIETNSATDFMNPGWKGYLPLEIINKSKNAIKLYPYMSMVQIMLIPLSSLPDKNYGEEKLANKYQNDDGGPSQWWRDKLYGQYRKSFEKSLTDEMLETLIERFNKVDDWGLYRFEKFFGRLKTHEIDNAQNLLEKFGKKEKWRSIIQSFLMWFFPSIQTILLGLSGKLLFETTHPSSHWIVWGFTTIWLVPTILYLFVREKKQYFDKL